MAFLCRTYVFIYAFIPALEKWVIAQKPPALPSWPASDIMVGMYSGELMLGDIARLRKKHPCGSYEWEVVRLGVDIGLVCLGCGHRILMARSTFNKRVKSIISVTPSTPEK